MKRLKLFLTFSILVFHLNSFAQGLNCKYCDKVLIKGQALYSHTSCSSESKKAGVSKIVRVHKYRNTDYDWLNILTSCQYKDFYDIYNCLWQKAVDEKVSNSFWNIFNDFYCSKPCALNSMQAKGKIYSPGCDSDWSTIPPAKNISKEANSDDIIWNCINKYNENWGYYKLLRGAGGDFYYEFSTMKINGEKTIFVYFKNGKFVIRGFDSNKDIPGETGKWSCLEGGGYKLDYDDGRKGVFGLTQK